MSAPGPARRPSRAFYEAGCAVRAAAGTGSVGAGSTGQASGDADGLAGEGRGMAATQERLELLSGLIERAMEAADYSPALMREANRHDLRLLLRRLGPSERDLRRLLGLFRRILWRLER